MVGLIPLVSQHSRKLIVLTSVSVRIFVIQKSSVIGANLDEVLTDFSSTGWSCNLASGLPLCLLWAASVDYESTGNNHDVPLTDAWQHACVSSGGIRIRVLLISIGGFISMQDIRKLVFQSIAFYMYISEQQNHTETSINSVPVWQGAIDSQAQSFLYTSMIINAGCRTI